MSNATVVEEKLGVGELMLFYETDFVCKISLKVGVNKRLHDARNRGQYRNRPIIVTIGSVGDPPLKRSVTLAVSQTDGN